jgi:hAT family C-terminal dimerisation region
MYVPNHLCDHSISNRVIQVLDPWISYEGMKIDFTDDSMLSEHLERSKSNLFIYFHDHYAPISTPPSIASLSAQTLPIMGSPQHSFTARYRRKEKASINELEEYFKLPAEDFDTCNPIQWWMGRRAQFPNLFRLARDILCIPGELF